MPNRVTIIIEADHPDVWGRIEVVRDFPAADYTRDAVLDAFEDALRGAGYHCPVESLTVKGAP